MNEINDLEEQRNNYYKAIQGLDSKEDIENNLPNPSNDNFKTLIVGIIELIKKDIMAANQLKIEYPEEYSPDELIRLNKIMEIVNNYLERVIKEYQEALEELNEKSEIKVPPCDQPIKRHLIFGKNKLGNIPFFNDVKKSIPREYYPVLGSMIESLIYDDVFHMNDKRWKNFVEHEKLKGLFERKEFKIRIILIPITKDIFYIEMVRMKKDNKSKIDQAEPMKRKDNLFQDYLNITKRIKEKVNVAELWAEEQENLAYIETLLNYEIKKGEMIK